jgi:hypothetical protein
VSGCPDSVPSHERPRWSAASLRRLGPAERRERAVSAPGRTGHEPSDWAGGWNEFQAARARFLATLAEQSALARLERAWNLPAHGSPTQNEPWEQEPSRGRLEGVDSPPQRDAPKMSEPQEPQPP